jgi:hypothetical protein
MKKAKQHTRKRYDLTMDEEGQMDEELGRREVRKSRLENLRERHQVLDDEVDRLSVLRHQTPMERQKLRELKVRRLRLRDLIDRFRREELTVEGNAHG